MHLLKFQILRSTDLISWSGSSTWWIIKLSSARCHCVLDCYTVCSVSKISQFLCLQSLTRLVQPQVLNMTQKWLYGTELRQNCRLSLHLLNISIGKKLANDRTSRGIWLDPPVDCVRRPQCHWNSSTRSPRKRLWEICLVKSSSYLTESKIVLYGDNHTAYLVLYYTINMACDKEIPL